MDADTVRGSTSYIRGYRLKLEQIIREKIRLEYKNIPYWIQVKVDFLI